MSKQRDAFRKQTGSMGEQLALRYLQSQGYKIIEQNWRCRIGEIDLIAMKNDTLIFLEIRSKRSQAFGMAEHTYTTIKKQRMHRLAYLYMQIHEYPLQQNFQIDFIAIDLNPTTSQVRHYPNVG